MSATFLKIESIPDKNTRANRGGRAPVHRMAKLEKAPTLRCSHRQFSSPAPVCGRPASVERVDPETDARTFLCRAHARDSDYPLVEPSIVRLVTVSCELVFAGVSSAADVSQAEAAAAVELAALGAGAVLSVRSVTSTLARYYPSVGAIGTARRPSDG
jgi:hypothetical protein